MKINNKDVVCFKVYVDKNSFFCGLYNTENNHRKIFEISIEKPNTEEYLVNTIKDIVKCFSFEDFIFCGYNNNHYDNAFINMLCSNVEFYSTAGIDTEYMLARFNDLHNKILHEDVETWKEYKYGKFFKAFDLMRMNFSKKERVSLSEIKFSLKARSILSIQDMSTGVGKYSAIANDLEAISSLLERSKDMIRVRLELSEEYKIGTLSYDDLTLGMKIFSILYSERSGKTLKELNKPKVPSEIKLEDIILPCIKFKTSFLQNKLEELKKKVINLSNPELEERFSYFGSDLSFSLGGLHSKNTPNVYKPSPWDTIALIDAESMYPHMMLNHNLYPDALKDHFVPTYMKMVSMRLKAKQDKDEEKNKLFKKTIVSIVGMFNSPSSAIYDPVTFYKITINSQFMLLMIAETLRLETNCKFINWNTDGIFIEVNKFSKTILFEQLNKFFRDFKVKFVVKYFEELYQYDCNNYFGVLDGWSIRKTTKTDVMGMIVGKGCFKEPWKSLKATNASIVTKAVMSHFLFKASVSKVINEAVEKDVYQFMLFSRIPDTLNVFYGETKVGNTNRYYYSKGGCTLSSRNPEIKSLNFISDKGHPVSLMNVERTIHDIDTGYYICKANSLIAQMTFIQLKMF